MTRDNRQILVNPHSSEEKLPIGALNLGEIAVQHTDPETAALYVETESGSTRAETIAKFITDKAIENLITSAQTELQTEIDGINEAVGLPHDPEQWNSGLTVWQAIEQTYEEMTAGTAAASTKIFIDEAGGHEEKYLQLRNIVDSASSAVNYYLKTEGIDESIESAYTIVNDALTVLSGAVESFSSATVERFETVETVVEQLSAATEEAIADIEERLDEIEEQIEANAVTSEDGSIVITTGANGTDLSVNVDGKSIVLNDNNELVADLMLSAITPSSVNVREEYALINAEGTRLGDTVKIYKDSSLYGASLGHVDDVLDDPTDPTSVVEGSGDTALDLIYHKEDGTYELVAIDVNDFLEESEFQDGLVVDNHVVKVLVDPESEEVVIGDSGETAPVLSVSEDGVKIDNIQAAIDYAVSKQAGLIDADLTGIDDHVSVEVVQENTELTQVVVTTSDIASEAELNTVEEAVGLAADGTYVAPQTGYASGSSTVMEGIQAISNALEAVSQKLNAASVVESASTENWVALTVEEVEPGTTALTLNDAALAEELLDIRGDVEAETSAREAADAELLGNSASTSAETSIMGIKKLLETITNDLNNNAVQNAEFGAVAEKDETVYGSNAGIEVVDNEGGEGKKVVLDLSLLKVDCGEY